MKTKNADLGILSTIHVAHAVSVFGQTYQTMTRDERLFGEIVHIFPECEKKEVLLFVRVLSVVCFDDHYYAYVVDKKEAFEMVSRYDLADIRPLSLLSCFQGDKVYLNPRYKIV